jgi:hypothetical protein
LGILTKPAIIGFVAFHSLPFTTAEAELEFSLLSSLLHPENTTISIINLRIKIFFIGIGFG